MFKTIFSKLVVIFIVVLAVAFTVAGLTLSILLGNYVTDRKADQLITASNYINRLFESYTQNIGNPIAEVLFSLNLDSYAENTGSIIWVVLEDGIVYKTSRELPDSLFVKDQESHLNKLPVTKQYSEILQHAGTKTEVGNFFGFFNDPYFKKRGGNNWLTIEKSFSYTDAKTGKEFLVAIYMHTPVPEVQKVRTDVFGYFWISIGIAVLISIILIYFFSQRISKPLKEIKNAARIIASGEFSKRLNIKSNDEIGELAKTFNQMAVALENLEEMRRGFIANVSHELRTPMTSIRGFIEGILDGTIPPERQNQYLTIVRDETNRLNRLVNNLLDLARMEAGEIKLVKKPFDINELVRRCVIKLETFLVEKNIMIEARFDEEMLMVNADADAIERVIYNLLHNAIKFTPQDGKITILVNPMKDKVLLSIEDTGSGIEKNELDMIWERFYKSDKSRSRDKTGTGLGLAIVKNIINEHGQQIWVESEPGVGTKFTFTLDRVEKLKELEE
jgi:Signal transduction histidine kinase